MSCQQATRFITSSNNNTLNHCNDLSNNRNISNNIIKENRITRVVQQEDPYVFTESVPTTPPILFNTQKTRTRLNDLTATTTTLSIGKLQQQQKLPLTETNGKITATSNVIKTQASLLATTATTATPTTIKNITQSLTTTSATTQLLSTTTSNNKKLTNVCIVRPQLQQQQPQHYHQQHLITSAAYEGDLKSISPPPLYTPPTPSLWQTPLLLETTTAAAVAAPITTPQPTTTTPQVANVAPQPPSVATSLQNSSIMVGCVTPTKQNVGGNTTTTTTLMNSSLTTTTNTTTAMAKVAPIIVHNNTPLTPTTPAPLLSPSSLDLDCSLQNLNQCLPPSKFHNHTLAQHLQKVECLKKSKKLNQLPDNLLQNDNGKVITISTSPLHTHPQQTTLSIPTSAAAAAATLQTINCTSSCGGGSPVKHSDNEDLNEIPVNVIFRMALVPQQQHQPHHENEKSSNNMKLLTPAKNISTTTAVTALPPPPPPPPQPQQIKINLNKNRTIPASKITNQMIKQPQNNMSSIQQQQEQQQPQQELQFPQFQRPLTIKKDILNLPLETVEKSIILTKKLTHTTSSSSKSTSRKLHTSFTNLIGDLPYNWQLGVGGGAGDCSTTKGAVAIVKLSQHNLDLDTSPLSTAAGLPYCLQQHWFNSYDFHKSSDLLAKKPINRSLAREERIALYKQQLRIQAMQLLSTRSLQKLPLKVARRRLLCVDRLIRKYQQNENELPANVKRCCFNGCDAYTLEMASHCQKHIVYNAAQHVFLPCTAKFADNTQCKVPVFDITHDLPLCIEHARKRDAYNRLLYEQRPRKISAPTSILLNETVVMSSSKLSAIAGGVGGGGLIIKTQNYQLQPKQKQQQHQQQLVVNKRPTLVNQQQTRKRKMNVGGVSNPVGRPQKRVKKNVEITNVATTTTTKATINRNQQQQMPRLTATNLKRKSSTTSLESIATSNSQHSTTSSTSQQLQQHQQQHQQLYGLTSSVATATTTTTSSLSTSATSLPPPALAPLSSGGAAGGLMVGHLGLPQHLFSFGHDNHPDHHHHHPNLNNINNDKHSFSSTGSVSSTTPTELKDFMSQFSFIAHRNQHSNAEITKTTDVNILNTNSNSNFTSSGMGSTTSLPTADDFLTQDMLSICENSSASSADTGLGGLSDPELMLGGPEDDIPLGDTHLLEEHDLANVLNSLPEDAFKELFATVHQDESDEIERAIELADKHLKTLQQTIGSELGDFLDFNDDMLMDNSDMCNTSTVSANSILDTSALFMGAGNGGGVAVSANATTLGLGGGAVSGNGGGLVQT